MALVIILAVISILMAAVLELGRQSRDALMLTMVETDALMAEEMTVSGIHLGMLILVEDAKHSDIDSLQEMWADPDLLSRAVQMLNFDDGTLSLAISDEMGKIQINALIDGYPGHGINIDQQGLWERLLNLVISSDRSLDNRDPSEIVNALKDWLDSGDDDGVTGLSGAEQPYYQSLEPPLLCANRQVDTLDEIFMIKGISRDMLMSEKNLFSDVDISTIFTVHGMDDKRDDRGRIRYQGTININTADMIVLAAMLPAGMEDQARELVEFREEKTENKDGYANELDRGWYRKVLDLTQKETREFERLIRYSSDIFSIRATAVIHGLKRETTGIVKREKNQAGAWTCKILRFAGQGL